MEEEGHLDADLVVIGFGPAGAASAIAAADAGARVLVLERADQGGGNALYAHGLICEIGAERGIDFLDALCFGRTDRDVLAAYLADLAELRGWLEALGCTTTDFEPDPAAAHLFPSWPNLPGGKDVGYYQVQGHRDPSLMGGPALVERLTESAAERGVEVLTGARATDLLVEDGRVVGVEFEHGGSGRRATAADGVALCCGGFEASAELRDAYLPIPTKGGVGSPLNEGDAIRLTRSLDAALWHMSCFFGWYGFVAAGFPAAFPIDFRGPSYLLTGPDGRRFADETAYDIHDRLKALSAFLPRRANRPGLPLFGIFDEATRAAGPLNGLFPTANDYEWSADNRAEIAAGWIVSADTPAGLANAIGVEPAVLTATIEEINEAAHGGGLDEFGRRRDASAALDLAGPLYAIELAPVVGTTNGGPRHDAEARVLGGDGSPIAGLYAAGGASGIWGQSTEHGGGLTDAMIFGRRAGAAAGGGV